MQKIFSYPIQIDKLTLAERKFSLEADEGEKAWIAEVFQVEGVKIFKASLSVKKEKNSSLIRVFGEVEAELKQKSIISLEDFWKRYETEFEVFFDTKATYTQIREEFEDINEEAPEPVVNGEIDLAAVAMEQIAILIDDYPRQEGEVFEFESEFDEETTAANNPFAVLGKIKK